MQFDKINILDGLAIISLAVGLVMAILFSLNDLSIGIVGALAGYIGGSKNSHREDMR